MIYFWNDKQLAQDLHNDIVPEKDKFIYFLLYIFYPILGDMLQSLMPIKHVEHAAFNPLNLIWYALALCLLMLFYSIPYDLNKKGDGLRFVERFICLSFPWGIRAGIVSIPLILIAMYPFLHSDFTFWFFAIALLAYFYMRLLMLIKIASGQA